VNRPAPPWKTYPETEEEARGVRGRTCGVLYLAGALGVLLSVALSEQPGRDETGLLLIVATALTVGAALVLGSSWTPTRVLHGAIALGTALICLCVYFSGTAAGVYETMFVWVVLLTAYFFPGRATALHVGWLLSAYAVTLVAVGASAGASPLLRWSLLALVLGVAATVMSMLAAGLQREMRQRRTLEAELQHLASHDALTGVANRRRLDEELHRELARARRHDWTLCAVWLDLDDFKVYNDRHGHAAGDELLRTAARDWQAQLRETDLLARPGGDEFVVILPDCPPHQARNVVERLRGATLPALSCSAGLAVWDGDESATALLGRADAALYESKQVSRPANPGA